MRTPSRPRARSAATTAAGSCSPAGRGRRSPERGICPAASSRRASTRSTRCAASCVEETGLEIEPEEFLGAWMDTYSEDDGGPATLNLYWTAHVVGGGDGEAADDVSELRWFAPDELPAPVSSPSTSRTCSQPGRGASIPSRAPGQVCGPPGRASWAVRPMRASGVRSKISVWLKNGFIASRKTLAKVGSRTSRRRGSRRSRPTSRSTLPSWPTSTRTTRNREGVEPTPSPLPTLQVPAGVRVCPSGVLRPWPPPARRP